GAFFVDFLTILLFIIGLALLVGGAEYLVRGAARLAEIAGISPLVIGLTVVAMGTSAPELAVSLKASFAGQSEIALGNVVGSNIANILLIIGVAALAAPLIVNRQLIRLDLPVMIGVSFLAYFMARDGLIGTLDGAVLFGGLAVYTTYLIWKSVRDKTGRPEVEKGSAGERSRKGVFVSVVYVVAGFVTLALGSRWLVDSAVAIATHFGVSKTIIGMTIVAIGTSLPEAATSVIASVRGERDIAVGNAVGSNIFNIMAVLGLTGLVSSHGVAASPEALQFYFPVMIVVAVVCLPVFFSGHLISRIEGGVFLVYYAGYLVYLMLDARSSALLPSINAAMLWVVFPLTALYILVPAVKAFRAGSIEER
ncbi:MAG: calcium/sodium antiporter, partial [bacterium]